MKINYSALTLIIIGLFMLIDGIFIGAISYDYSFFGIEFLDPFISHWWLGGLLAIIGIVDWKLN